MHAFMTKHSTSIAARIIGRKYYQRRKDLEMFVLFGIMKNNFSINSIGNSSYILQNTCLK